MHTHSSYHYNIILGVHPVHKVARDATGYEVASRENSYGTKELRLLPSLVLGL